MINAYTIGVHLALSTNASSAISALTKQMLGLHNTTSNITSGFNRMKVAVAGMAGVTIGATMLGGLYELSKAGEKYTHQLVEMRLQGFSFMEQQDAIRQANLTASAVLTTTPTENLQAIRELRGALNSAGASPAAATQEAIEHLSAVQRAQAVMTSALGSDRHSDVFEMVKALEDIGATKDPDRFERLLDGFTRSSITFGGRLTGKDFFQTLKYTRGAGAGYSDEFIQYYLPTLMQELKAGNGSGAGGGAGNPLASLFQTVVGGNISNKSEAEWERMGLIDPRKVLRTSTGAVKGILPGGFYGSKTAVQNPYFYIRDVLLPALIKHGAGPDHPELMREILAHLFTNRVSQQMAGLLLQTSKMEGDRKLTEAAMHMMPAAALATRTDPVLARKAMAAQFDRVETNLGKAMTPTTTEAIFQIARGLSYVAETIEAHPTATKAILTIVAALGALLVVAGTVAIGMAALATLGGLGIVSVAAGITALSVALGYLATRSPTLQAVNDWGNRVFSASTFKAINDWGNRTWATITGWVRDLFTGKLDIMKQSGDFAKEVVTSLKSDLGNIWIGITEGLLDLVKKLGAFLTSLPSRVMGAIGGVAAPAGVNPNQLRQQMDRTFAAPLFNPTAYRGPQTNSRPVVLHNIMYLDSEPVYRSTMRHMDRDSRSAAQPGMTGHDSSETPFLSGGMIPV